MHQYKTVAKVLLILSIFNLAFAVPVVREICDAHDDAVPPVVVRNVAAMLKERRSSGPTPSPPPPDGPTSSPPPPDGSTSSHPLPPPPDGSTASHGSSPSDGSLHESPSHPGGPAALEVSSPLGGTAPLPVVPASDNPVPVDPTSSHSLPQSPEGSIPLHVSSPSDGSLHESPSHPAALEILSPPGGTGSPPVVPASDQPVHDHSTSTTPDHTPVTHDMPHPNPPPPASRTKSILLLGGLAAYEAALVAAWAWYFLIYRHKNHRRTIGHDCSTAKGSLHPCLDYQLKDHLQD